ncbi:MAG: PLP-dependent aspartate aminotransferase family protein [bacterium]
MAMKIGTKGIHVGQPPEAITGAVIPPLFQSATFAQKNPGEPFAEFEYTRAGNPTFTRLEETLASLENGRYATVFSSGVGALTAWLASIGKCHIVANEDLYGGTYRLLNSVFINYGVQSSFARSADIKSWIDAIRPDTKWFLIETPTNPLLNIVDLVRACKIAHSRNIKVLVDNTFASPCFQQPLGFGADAVLHSTTKYICGHSDVIGGALITDDAAQKEQFDFYRKAMGLNPSPFDCWLVSRGVKTLAIRMAQHEKNASAISKLLKKARNIEKVLYPGLKSHPQFDLASRQMQGAGGIISIRFDNPRAAKRFMKKLKLFCLAESLGGVESLVCQPSSMTHASMPAAYRARLGIDDSLVRLSVGIEDTDDLLSDVASALKAI